MDAEPHPPMVGIDRLEVFAAALGTCGKALAVRVVADSHGGLCGRHVKPSRVSVFPHHCISSFQRPTHSCNSWRATSAMVVPSCAALVLSRVCRGGSMSMVSRFSFTFSMGFSGSWGAGC